MRLTDEQCDSFRRHPGSFNDMIRAVYEAGAKGLYTEKDMLDFGYNAVSRREFLGVRETITDVFEIWRRGRVACHE